MDARVQRDGMLRNKVGIKKMITDNGLVLLMLLPQSVEFPAVPVNMGFDGSGSLGRRSRDPKGRGEGIFHSHVKFSSVCQLTEDGSTSIDVLLTPKRGHPKR